MSSLDLEGESVSELGAGPSGSNGVEALQLLEHEQGRCMFSNTSAWGAVDAKAEILWKKVEKLTSWEETSESFPVQSLLHIIFFPQEIFLVGCC